MDHETDLVEVANFQQAIEAEIVRGKLESEGIPAFILDAHLIGNMPHLAQALGGVKVQVARKDLEAARAALSEVAQEEPLKCVGCAGTHVELERKYSFRSLLNLFMFPIAFSLYRKSYRCRDCGRTWPWGTTEPAPKLAR